jgi:hypothetical protein
MTVAPQARDRGWLGLVSRERLGNAIDVLAGMAAMLLLSLMAQS